MVSRIKHKCSICGKPVQDAFKPFCSPRCATIDLGRWLGEGYKIPAEETPDDVLAFDDHEDDD